MIKLELKLFLIFLIATHNGLSKKTNGRVERKGKVLSLFNILTFRNGPCNGLSTTASGNTRMGTCYTSSECGNRGGSSSGNCAAGFGVCCLFLLNSGTVAQNCSYIRNEGFPSTFSGTTSPTFTIRKCSSDVCSVRLDFESFTLAGPTNSLEADGGACATESLMITSSTNEPFPTICGQNRGQHVYLDLGAMGSNTATLAFTLSSLSTSTSFEIKVTQIECGANYAQPDGCFQYFTGTQGTISTFNFFDDSDTSHLANQRYTVCIRPALGMCCVEYSACSEPNSQSLAAPDTAISNAFIDGECTQDYVIIQGASTQCNSPLSGPLVSRFCGRVLNTQNNAMLDNIPVCDCIEPFELTVVTDDTTEINSDTDGNRGFCVNYRQLPC